MMIELHPSLADHVADVASLLGTWTGNGHGEYPTIPSFDYVETVTFGHVGKPFLTYTQQTAAATPDEDGGGGGAPLHAESGFWRFPAPRSVEVVIAHPTGIAELQTGTIDTENGAVRIELASISIGSTVTAKEVTAVERSFRVVDDRLEYTVRMAAVGEPLTHHLAATLRRTG